MDGGLVWPRRFPWAIILKRGRYYMNLQCDGANLTRMYAAVHPMLLTDLRLLATAPHRSWAEFPHLLQMISAF